MLMDADCLAMVRQLLALHVPDIEVWAFGSRVRGNPKPYSDLDLALVGREPLHADLLARLSYDFEESNLPFRVDLLDLHGVTPEFRAMIESQYEVIQSGNSRGA